jgi:hypothetical protein
MGCRRNRQIDDQFSTAATRKNVGHGRDRRPSPSSAKAEKTPAAGRRLPVSHGTNARSGSADKNDT